MKVRMMKIKEKNVQDWYDKEHDTPRIASRPTSSLNYPSNCTRLVGQAERAETISKLHTAKHDLIDLLESISYGKI